MAPPKTYQPEPIEQKWYERWLKDERFLAIPNPSHPRFSIVIPPPNVTGTLHMGHALNITFQDILIRWKRMLGRDTLWLPGTDHAGIATQNVVEQHLTGEGLRRQDLGRAAFEERVWEWKKKSGDQIIRQLKRLGASCDWSRQRFTLDQGLSRAVTEVFVQLYGDGLIYRDMYIVNWCPRCQTAISDLEVDYRDTDGSLYFIRYDLKKDKGSVEVATTRPETMLGDTGVAFHPDDGRFSALEGKRAILPILNRELPIFADTFVDREFGTGIVKVTPAHDENDFNAGKRHGLDLIEVIDTEGKMTGEAGKFIGLDRFECRQKLLEDLQEEGFLVRTEPYRHRVGFCRRCDTIVEPRASTQWFVRVKPLAEPAIAAVRDGTIRFVPASWENIYFQWMENLHDWCISRQLWWGHRIPAWYCASCEEITVSETIPRACQQCGGERLQQDEDVLDTWFSSALWPFSTLGWPEGTEDLKRYYPTDILVTGFDIIFFWVARMIMMGLRFTGQPPFHTVLIHNLIRDEKGEKMSKSKGNVIDPLDLIERYGADALRFSLAIQTSPGKDVSFSEERTRGYRAFCNKLSNACRFIFLHVDGDIQELPDVRSLRLADRWILSRIQALTQSLIAHLEQFEFHHAADVLYHFLWHEFCDWYLELIKPRLSLTGETAESAQAVLARVMRSYLRLLHPLMPFLTEELWQAFRFPEASITVAPFPSPNESLIDPEAEEDMAYIQEIVTELRTIRSEMRLPPSLKVRAIAATGNQHRHQLLERHQEDIIHLCHLTELQLHERFEPEAPLPKAVSNETELYLSLEESLVPEKERARLEKELAEIMRKLQILDGKLANENFLKKAPAAVVEKDRQAQKEYRSKKEKLEQSLRQLASTE